MNNLKTETKRTLLEGNEKEIRVQVPSIIQTAHYLTEEESCQFTQQETSLQDI
jgi:hypothetical protein